MEFTNEIFFNKKPVQGESILITYSGKLFKEYSAEVTIVYGFGANWEHTSQAIMQPKENGFEALITMQDYDTFNFCFKNNYNIWDNNSGFNYITAIDAPTSTQNQGKAVSEGSDSKSENIEEKENTKEENKNENEDSKVETEGKSENGEANESNTSKIEETFSNLLDSILEYNQNIADVEKVNSNVNLDNGYGLQSVDEIKETDFTSCDKIFDDLYNEFVNEKDGSIESKSIQTDVKEKINNESYEELLKDINKDENSSITSKDLNSLMDDILSSVPETKVSDDSEKVETKEISENSENEVKNEVQKSETVENSNLPVVQSSFDEFLDRIIDNTFEFFRDVFVGCKKIGVLIKNKAKVLLNEDDD